MEIEAAMPEPEGARGRLALIDTLGARLADQAQRIAARHAPQYAWAVPGGVLLRHMARLPAPAGARFERSEAPVPAALPAGPRPHEVDQPPAAATYRPALSQSNSPEPLPKRDKAPEGVLLPPDVRERLRPLAGPAAAVMRVHHDATADTVARARRADAVAVGRDVYFREGKFRPREPRGFGLLVHEATHIVQLMRPGAAWRRATGAGVREDEAEAVGQERRTGSPVASGDARALTVPDVGSRFAAWQPAGHAAGTPPGARPLAAPPPTARPVTPGSMPAAQAMTAETNRDMETPAAAPVLAPINLEELRRSLARDLMRQLRAEFERGG